MAKKTSKRAAGRPPRSALPALETTILDAASRAFASRGFAATTMRQIAAEAHVSPQTLYARFDDKTQLYAALMDSRTTALLGAMEAPFRDDSPPPAALRAFGVTLLSTFLSTDLQRLHQMVIGEAQTFPELARTFFSAGPERGRNLLTAYLTTCVAAGLLRIDQVDVAAEQFIGSLVGSIVIRSTLAQQPTIVSERDITNWVQVAVAVFLSAYAPPEKSARIKS